MVTPREKWKRSLSKLKLSRKDSTLSLVSQTSIMEEEEDSENEVEQYLTKLKQKTGLKNLWSGHKFKGFVDNDRTPDISTDTDEELDMKLSMNAEHLRELQLDSDEDEMRIDFMRHKSLHKVDENNNEEENDDGDEPLNLMQNIHFAELENAEVELSDGELKAERPDDYLPNVYTLDFGGHYASGNNDDDDESSGPLLGKNVRMLDVSESVNGSSKSSKNVKRRTSNNEVASSVPSEEEISELDTLQTASPDAPGKPKTSNSDYSLSDFESELSSPKRTTKATPKSSPKRKPKSKKDRSGSRDHTSSVSSISETSRSSQSTSSKGDTRSYKKSKSNRNSHRQAKKIDRSISHNSVSPQRKSPVRTVETQTETVAKDDYTDDVLKFRYTWKQPSPSNIAVHTVDSTVMDVLTNYNPAVLAANDMLKFHLDLLRKHITNSQQLYEAYSNEGLNTNYRYTSFEDTMGYIERNRPKVISFEEALKEIRSKDKH